MGGSSKAYAKRVMPSETAAAIEMQIANQSAVKNLMLCVMKNLFEPCQAGQLQLASRIVMAPLTRNRAPQALANALMAEYYAQRANRNFGTLVASHTPAFSPTGKRPLRRRPLLPSQKRC